MLNKEWPTRKLKLSLISPAFDGSEAEHPVNNSVLIIKVSFAYFTVFKVFHLCKDRWVNVLWQFVSILTCKHLRGEI